MKHRIAISKKQLEEAGFVEYEQDKFAHHSQAAPMPEREISRTGRKKVKTVTKISKKVTKIDHFVILVKQDLNLDLVPEYKFHPERRWRFDYALPELKIAIEQEGGIDMKGGGAHSRPANIKRDIEKYTAAAVMGWVVIRRIPKDLITNETIELIKVTVNGRDT